MSDKQQGHANQNTTTRTSDKGSKKIKVTANAPHDKHPIPAVSQESGVFFVLCAEFVSAA